MFKSEVFPVAEYQRIAELVVQHAKKLGAEQSEVSISCHKGQSVSVLNGDVETVEHENDIGMAISISHKNKVGSSSTNIMTEEAVTKAVEKAWDVAQFSEEDEYTGLADKDLMAWQTPDLDLFHPEELSTQTLVKNALESESAALKYDDKIQLSEGAHASTSLGLSLYANSHGFSNHYQGTHYSVSCSVIAKQAEEMQRDSWWHSERIHSNLPSSHSIGEIAASHAMQRLGAKKVKTQQVPVIFSSQTAKGIFSAFLGAISGSSQYRKNSFLLDCLGQRIFPEWLSIEEQPCLLQGNASLPFDADGIATSSKYILEQGKVQQYILSQYSARRLNMTPTGNANGVKNLRLHAPFANYQNMLDEAGTGFIVTDLMGQGVNALTGDYSRGAFGYWFENGVVQYPVDGVTIAGNLKSMFKNIRALADDVDTRGNMHCGSLWIDGMTLAG